MQECMTLEAARLDNTTDIDEEVRLRKLAEHSLEEIQTKYSDLLHKSEDLSGQTKRYEELQKAHVEMRKQISDLKT